MKWVKVDGYAARSMDPPGYWINLAILGGTVAYTAVRAGDGSGPEILHVERGLPAERDHLDRIAGYRACVAACEDHASLCSEASDGR